MFGPAEARTFLARAELATPVGPDPNASARIATRCGHLPLALGLVAAHIRRASGWTLTDHADRLDERHHTRRLDAGVELALELSYRHLPDVRQRALRLVALHPGQDLGSYAAAALTESDREVSLARTVQRRPTTSNGPRSLEQTVDRVSYPGRRAPPLTL